MSDDFLQKAGAVGPGLESFAFRTTGPQEEMSAEQYQVTHMQFELLSLWRGIEVQDSQNS